MVQSQSTSQNLPAGGPPAVPVPPVTSWKTFPSRDIPNNFNYGTIYYYLLESIQFKDHDGGDQSDESSDANLSHMTSKPLRKGQQYVDSNNVVNVKDNTAKNSYYLKAGVLPSMQATEPYRVHVTISNNSGQVLDGSCECKASALGRCSHVGALLLFLWKHVKTYGYKSAVCTDLPCQWNKGAKRKNPQDIQNAHYGKQGKMLKKIISFDPRPPSQRNTSHKTTNQLLTDLAALKEPSMWETLLNYQYEDYVLQNSSKDILTNLVGQLCNNLADHGHTCSSSSASVVMIPDTQGQSSSPAWHLHRWQRVTASISKEACHLGQTLNKDPHPVHRYLSFLRRNLWGLDTFHPTKWMAYGSNKESTARDLYCQIKQQQQPSYTVDECGLFVNLALPELGASPDGLVFDPSEIPTDGLLEIKVLKLLQEFKPTEIKNALQDGKLLKTRLQSSCISLTDDGKLELKQGHAYYYQIQFQLLVCDRKWCDFVLYSSKGSPSIQRIWRDDTFIQTMYRPILNFWHKVMAPEIFEMRVPRNLTPFVL